MKKKAFLALGLSLAVLVTLACEPKPKPITPEPVDGDAGDVYPTPPANIVQDFPEGSPAALSSPCGKACENLRTVPCKEGFTNDAGVTCYSACLAMAKLQRVPTGCWATKHTPADVRTCGGIACTPPLPAK